MKIATRLIVSILTLNLMVSNMSMADTNCQSKALVAAEKFLYEVYNPVADAGVPWDIFSEVPVVKGRVFTFDIFENERGGYSGELHITVSKACSPVNVSIDAQERVFPD